jgi:hypothetical protein
MTREKRELRTNNMLIEMKACQEGEPLDRSKLWPTTLYDEIIPHLKTWHTLESGNLKMR